MTDITSNAGSVFCNASHSTSIPPPPRRRQKKKHFIVLINSIFNSSIYDKISQCLLKICMQARSFVFESGGGGQTRPKYLVKQKRKREILNISPNLQIPNPLGGGGCC